jgi:hypothetical protein
MLRLLRCWFVVLPAFAVGCQSMPNLESTPILPMMGGSPIQDQNPVFIPLNKLEYGRLFETSIEVLGDYGFEITESNRYSGHIEATPRVAPGIAMLLKPGSPDWYERWLATLQTYRHRVTVIIQTADPSAAEFGGYFVEFVVRKELEDLARPLRSTVGGAVFRSENTIERQTEVIDATFFEPNWMYRGRDAMMEQELIRRFKCAMARSQACGP